MCHWLYLFPINKDTLFNTRYIWLSVHPLKCNILLHALFIEVKIPIKKITLFHDEITLNQIETMLQTFRKQQKEFLEKIKLKEFAT